MVVEVDTTTIVLVEVVGLMEVVVGLAVLVVMRSTMGSVVAGASPWLTHPADPSETAQSTDERAFHMPAPPAKATVGPFKESVREQAESIARSPELIAGADLGSSAWSFPDNQTAPGPFASMGLLDSDGSLRPAGDAWRAAGEAGS